MSTRSDAEQLARTRILLGSVVVYLLAMAFMWAGDHFYEGTRYLWYTRLATVPFFLLLLRRWTSLVRVRPPALIVEARRLTQLGRHAAARDSYQQARQLEPPVVRQINRARRILQDGLAVTVAQEVLLEQGRCSLALGELERAVSELAEVQALLPARAEVAMDLAEALCRADQPERAAQVLRQALPRMDAEDQQTLREQPQLLRLLDDAPLPARSAMWPKIMRERAVLALTVAAALVHGAHLYLGLF